MKESIIKNNEKYLIEELLDKLYYKPKPIILCLGSEKIIADSLGPLVGYFLQTQYKINTFVYGALNRAITTENFLYYYEHILLMHKNQPILVVDASLGTIEKLGTIQIKNSGIVFANNKYAKEVGDVSITGIVLPQGLQCKCLLKQTKLALVYDMAQKIASAIFHTFKVLY